MATVICIYCKQQFNRDKEPYVQIPHGTQFRYAHGHCYLDAVNDGRETAKYTIWDPATSTTCFWCHKAILPNHPDVMEMPQLPGRYVHTACNAIHPADDKEELLIYLIKLYKLKNDYVLPRFMLQLSEYEKQYNFTYSGMLKALKYWYEVKKQPVNENYGLGIIPHIYKQAYDYYYHLWLGQQKNENKVLSDYIPKDIEITIPVPQRQITKRRLFTFLDEEDLNGEQ